LGLTPEGKSAVFAKASPSHGRRVVSIFLIDRVAGDDEGVVDVDPECFVV